MKVPKFTGKRWNREQAQARKDAREQLAAAANPTPAMIRKALGLERPTGHGQGGNAK